MRRDRGRAGRLTIVTRLVIFVAAAMAVVLVAGAGFVFWRVAFALNRQLDRDLEAYREIVERAVAEGTTLPEDTPGESFQVYDVHGGVVGGNATVRLIPRGVVRDVAAGGAREGDTGALFPPDSDAYQWVADRVTGPHGPVVVAYAIDRSDHDEALRELLLQLLIADLATLAAASLVGYLTARIALTPVERYRAAVARAGAAEHARLPVPTDRDDELTRLGHTFNDLLDRIARGRARERQFLADASHELRSPLSLMRAEVEVARVRPPDPAETGQMLASLGAQIDRLVGLCNALLDLEELRSDQDPGTEQVPLAELVDEVGDRHADVARGRGMRIENRVPPSLTVRANRRWLDVALSNLVANALRYGAGTVRVSASAGAGVVRLAVEDDGPGFPPEFVRTAFDRFTRAEQSRSTPGTGLGLSLVLAVAEAHGGTASIDGSRVCIELPARAEGG